MQTFLPYSSFTRSAECLDDKRLGKQRVEALTILRVLRGEVNAWQNHPAVKMWRGYTISLAWYGLAICSEWKYRGFIDNIRKKIVPFALEVVMISWSDVSPITIDPPWLGDERVHRSHRSNLLRKMPEHYLKFGWKEADDLPYYWPVR